MRESFKIAVLPLEVKLHLGGYDKDGQLLGVLSMSSTVPLLLQGAISFINIYLVLLIIRVLLSWFPTINWYNQPWMTLSQLTDPYLNLFRAIIPPLGGIDFSPILAFLVLQFAVTLLTTVGSSSASFGF
ncbi:MAG: YggT family protein [Gloeomargarita sp. HHBFW_bins_162]